MGGSFSLAPQIAKVMATMCDKCLVKIEKAINSYKIFVREEKRSHSHNFYCSILLQLFHSVIIVVNLLLCLIYKFNFIIGIYIQEKTVYMGFYTIQGFRCPLGVLECIPLWIRGDYCLDNIIKNFIRELETIKRIKWNSITNHCNNLKEELIDGFDSRLDKPEERISKLEDNSVEGVNENTEKKTDGI